MICNCGRNINVKVKKVYKDAILPKQATSGSAGFDLSVYLDLEDSKIEGLSCGPAQICINPNERIKLGTGLKFELPEGYVMMIYPRGSMGIKKGLMLQNTVGILDADYRGECFLFVVNTSNKVIYIENGERIAQAIVVPYPKVVFEEVEELSITNRDEGHSGSTGRF